MSRYGGYIYNVMTCNIVTNNIERQFFFWLVLRGDNAVLISLISKTIVH